MDQLLNANELFIVAFMSPAFCIDPTCGPQIDTLYELSNKYESLPIIHIETYLNPVELKNDFDKKKINPIIEEWGVDEVISSAMSVLSIENENLERAYVGGTSQVAAAFEEVERVQQVLSVLERQFVVVSLMRDVINRGLSVAIGSETGVEPLSDCSLVVAPYGADGESAGSIAVLGPTRMNYSRALATVAVVGRQLGNRLIKG